MSSGFNFPLRALFAKSFTALVIPTKFNWSAFLIIGTIKFPSAKAAAIPKLMAFLFIILSPSTAILIIGNSLIAFATACIKIGV